MTPDSNRASHKEGPQVPEPLPSAEEVEERESGGRLEIPALLAAWLLPGTGHFMLGRRGRGLGFLVLVLCSLSVGIALNGNLHRVVADQPLSILATLGSMGVGAPYFVLRYLVGYAGEVAGPWYEVGSAFVLTAGLMNLLLILDVWDILRGKKA